ncbi:unnamed protein product [marine sediment metagenome]|uniref:Uncharacterized protein n=1 Tax=marine sediment metagenome TaxID=412755 RepID=X0S1H7_9ZZZZ
MAMRSWLVEECEGGGFIVRDYAASVSHRREGYHVAASVSSLAQLIRERVLIPPEIEIPEEED